MLNMNLVFINEVINYLQHFWWASLPIVVAICTLFIAIIQTLMSKPLKINLMCINRNTTQELSEETYKERTVEVIESAPELLYAIVIGPHFLEPDWFIQKRLEKEGRKKSFAMTLRKYIDDSFKAENKENRKIRLILRNNIRYAHVLKKYIKKDEINDLIRDMKYNLHSIFDKSDAKLIIKFHCMDDPGYEQIIVTKKDTKKVTTQPIPP